jgi:hypothetical protein
MNNILTAISHDQLHGIITGEIYNDDNIRLPGIFTSLRMCLLLLLSIDQCLAPAAIFDHRRITLDEFFTHAQLRAEGSLSDDHAPGML